jgi:hypothetical protein
MKFSAVINKLILAFLFSVKTYGRNVVKKMQESNIYYGRKFFRKFCRNFGRNHCFYAQKNRPLEQLLQDEDQSQHTQRTSDGDSPIQTDAKSTSSKRKSIDRLKYNFTKGDKEYFISLVEKYDPSGILQSHSMLQKEVAQRSM